MRRTARFVIAGLATFIVGGGFGGNYQEVTPDNMDYRPTGAHMTLGQAVQVAEQEALHKKISLAQYRNPEFIYSSDNHWIILYRWKVEMPGGYFYVDIDDRTQYANLMPGE